MLTIRTHLLGCRLNEGCSSCIGPTKVTIFLVQIRRDRTLSHGLLSVGPKCHAE